MYIPVALRPNAGHGLPILEFSRSHTATHHSRQDSSGRVISVSQRSLPDNTQNSQQIRPCPRWDSNSQSQQASGRRPTPQTARPLGPTFSTNQLHKKNALMGMGLIVDGMGTISNNLYCTSKKGTPLPQCYNNRLLYSFLPV